MGRREKRVNVRILYGRVSSTGQFHLLMLRKAGRNIPAIAIGSYGFDGYEVHDAVNLVVREMARRRHVVAATYEVRPPVEAELESETRRFEIAGFRVEQRFSRNTDSVYSSASVGYPWRVEINRHLIV